MMRGIVRTLAGAVVGLFVMVGLPTAAQAAAPPPVDNLTANPMVSSLSLSWTNPVTSPDWSTTEVRAVRGTVPPASLTDGFELTRGTGSVFLVDPVAPGAAYSFSVFALDSAGAAAPAKSITVYGSSLSLSVAPGTVTYGAATTLSGRLVDAQSGGGLGGEFVDVFGRRPGSTSWNLVDVVQTGGDGSYAVSTNAVANTEYEAYFFGSGGNAHPGHLGSTVGPVRESVAPRVGLAVNRGSARLGTTFVIRTSVLPGHPGQRVALQRFYRGGWHTVAIRRLSSTSATAFPIRPSTRGVYKYRVVKPADADHIAGISRSVFVRAV